MARQRAVDIDTQQPLRLGPAKRTFRILEIGDQRETAPAIGLAVERWGDMARGPLKETHAEPRFELFHRVRHGRARQAEILRGEREAASLRYRACPVECRRRPRGERARAKIRPGGVWVPGTAFPLAVIVQASGSRITAGRIRQQNNGNPLYGDRSSCGNSPACPSRWRVS